MLWEVAAEADHDRALAVHGQILLQSSRPEDIILGQSLLSEAAGRGSPLSCLVLGTMYAGKKSLPAYIMPTNNVHAIRLLKRGLVLADSKEGYDEKDFYKECKKILADLTGENVS